MNVLTALISAAERMTPWWPTAPGVGYRASTLETGSPLKSGAPAEVEVSKLPRAWQEAHLVTYTVSPAEGVAPGVGEGVAGPKTGPELFLVVADFT